MNALGVIKAFLEADNGKDESLTASALADLFEEAGDTTFANQLRDKAAHAWLLHPNDSDVWQGDEDEEAMRESLSSNRHEFRCARDVWLFRRTMYDAEEWFGRDDGLLVADSFEEAVDYLKEKM